MSNRRANVSFEVVANSGATASNPAVLMHYAIPDGTGTAVISSTWLLLDQLLKFAGIITKESDPVATKAVNDLKEIVDNLPTSEAIEPIKTSIQQLTDNYGALKTTDETINTAIKALQQALANLPASGATQEQIDDINAKIKKASDAVKALAGKTLYTTDTTIQASSGDTVCIVGSGDIQLETGPVDGAEIRVIDPLELIKATKNNVIPGTGDFIGQGQGTTEAGDSTPLSFEEDNPLSGGILTLRYRAAAKTWNVFASITSSSATIDKATVDRITAAETELATTKALIAELFVESDQPPNFDLPNWRFWQQTHLVGSNWVSKLYRRLVKTNDARLIDSFTYSSLEEISPGIFKVQIEGGINFQYEPARGSSYITQISFPAGTYIASELGYIDNTGALLRQGVNNSSLTDTQVAVGLGFLASPPNNAVSGRMRLYKVDRSFTEYIFTLV